MSFLSPSSWFTAVFLGSARLLLTPRNCCLQGQSAVTSAQLALGCLRSNSGTLPIPQYRRFRHRKLLRRRTSVLSPSSSYNLHGTTLVTLTPTPYAFGSVTSKPNVKERILQESIFDSTTVGCRKAVHNLYDEGLVM